MRGAIPLFPICLHGMNRCKYTFTLDCKLAPGTRNDKEIWFVNLKNPVFVQFTLCSLLSHGLVCSIGLYTRVVLLVAYLSLCTPKTTCRNLLGSGDRGPYVPDVWPDSFNLPTSGHTAWPVTLHSNIVYYLQVGKRCDRIASTALFDLANA